jgi:uncharacterized protein (TIGR00251 family)
LINPSSYIINGFLKVAVKPGKKETKILRYDPDKEALVVEIGAQAQDNKANIELVKYLSKMLKRNVEIKSGHTSKQKVLRIS